MNRRLLLLFFSLFSVQIAQSQPEALVPLNGNHLLQRNISLRSYPDLYVYSIDTIGLPFLDEFSRDRFKKYNAQPGDANVTSQEFFKIYDQTGTILYSDTVKYMRTQTYLIEYDTAGGSLTQTLTPLDSVYITINDLSAYPIQSDVDSVWPRYNLVDSLFDLLPPDTVWIALPDYVQDSVMVYFVSAVGDASLWQDNFAYRNNRYPIDPPTIGVATLDGLDDFGYPYDFVNVTLTDVCDYLTSKPLALGTYSAADSLYLSFYYQSTGRGNSPEVGDSLVLEFWSPDSSRWFHIWATPGIALDDFDQVMIPIKAAYYLNDGFQFRFKNYGNLCGALDHWHIDYVYLNSIRTQSDTIKQDAAYVYDVLSLLKTYTAMPWSHFKWDPAGYMADTLSVYQKNNDAVSRIIANQDMNIFYQGALQGTITAPLNPSAAAFSSFSSLYDIETNGFVYDTSLAPTCAAFDVEVSFNPGSNFQLNDTVFFTQRLENYYAYDDGSAEAAYGPQGVGAKLAYHFFIPNQDSLRSVLIHFEPSVSNVTSKAFFLTIWDATGTSGAPGNIIYQNTSFLFPDYPSEYNGFVEYLFDAKTAVSGNFYVGWQQLELDRLNIGFDLNTNNQSHIYYNTSGSWINTSFQGSLMMRPVFASDKDILAGVQEETVPANSILLYPNPANDVVYFSSEENVNRIEIFDLSGRLTHNEVLNGARQFSVTDLQSGIYLIRYYASNGNLLSNGKFVIQR